MKDTITKAVLVEQLVERLRSLNHHVTYEDARALLTPEEFTEFDEGCRCMCRTRTPTDEEQRLIERMSELRKIAAERRKTPA